MKFVNMAWLLGGITALGLGMAAQACSSSSNSGTSGSGATGGPDCTALTACCPKLSGANNSACLMLVADNVDSACASYLEEIPANTCSGTTSSVGASSTVGSSVGNSSSSIAPGGGSSGTGSSATSSSSCETASLFPETKPGVYCPFSGVDGGKAITCAAADHCCEPPEVTGQTTAPSTCEAAATACPTSGSTDWGCLGPTDCSGATPVCCGTGTIGMDTGCTTAYVSGFTGTSCAASCGTYKVCETDSDCGAGSAAGTCQPAKAKGGQFGHCGT